MRDRVAEAGLGEVRGDHAVVTVTGVTMQVLRGCLLLLWLVLLVTTVVNPAAVNDNAAVVTAVVAGVYAVKFAWRRLSARLGVNRCCLCADGVVVTGLLGRIRDCVAWSEVTGVQQMTVVGHVMACHRVEIFRSRSATPLWFVAPGVKSALVQELLEEGKRSGALR